jgi:hypothetical protein
MDFERSLLDLSSSCDCEYLTSCSRERGRPGDNGTVGEGLRVTLAKKKLNKTKYFSFLLIKEKFLEDLQTNLGKRRNTGQNKSLNLRHCIKVLAWGRTTSPPPL